MFTKHCLCTGRNDYGGRSRAAGPVHSEHDQGAMMQFSWPIFLLIMGLGILQLAVGVIFGRALPLTKDKSEESYPLDSGRLRKFANRLSGLVASVADDVGDHQLRIEQVSKSLTDADPGRVGSSGEAGLDGVARIIQINERLQTRLGDAEEKLQRQTQQIESHITEARTDPLTGLYNRLPSHLYRLVT